MERRSSNGGGDGGPRASYANEDIVGLLLIKTLPQGRGVRGLIKNVIADVIKRRVMIPDNYDAAGRTSARDLRNVHHTGKSQFHYGRNAPTLELMMAVPLWGGGGGVPPTS